MVRGLPEALLFCREILCEPFVPFAPCNGQTIAALGGSKQSVMDLEFVRNLRGKMIS